MRLYSGVNEHVFAEECRKIAATAHARESDGVPMHGQEVRYAAVVYYNQIQDLETCGPMDPTRLHVWYMQEIGPGFNPKWWSAAHELSPAGATEEMIADDDLCWFLAIL